MKSSQTCLSAENIETFIEDIFDFLVSTIDNIYLRTLFSL